MNSIPCDLGHELIFGDLSVHDLRSLQQTSKSMRALALETLLKRFPVEQRVFVGGGNIVGYSRSGRKELSETKEAYWIVMAPGLANMSFLMLPDLPIPCGDCSADITPDGQIVLAGSVAEDYCDFGEWGAMGTTKIFILHPGSQQWVIMPALPDVLRHTDLHLAASADPGLVLLADERFQLEPRLFPFRLNENTLVPLPSLQIPRTNGLGRMEIKQLQFDGERLVVIGAFEVPTSFSSERIRAITYDPITQVWTTLAEFTTPRNMQAMCLTAHESLVITGGFNMQFDRGPVNLSDYATMSTARVLRSCEVVKVGTSSSLPLPDCVGERHGHRLVPVYGGTHLLHLGGACQNNLTTEGMLRSVELFDSVAEEWIQLPGLRRPVHQPAVCVWPRFKCQRE